MRDFATERRLNEHSLFHLFDFVFVLGSVYLWRSERVYLLQPSRVFYLPRACCFRTVTLQHATHGTCPSVSLSLTPHPHTPPNRHTPTTRRPTPKTYLSSPIAAPPVLPPATHSAVVTLLTALTAPRRAAVVKARAVRAVDHAERKRQRKQEKRAARQQGTPQSTGAWVMLIYISVSPHGGGSLAGSWV